MDGEEIFMYHVMMAVRNRRDQDDDANADGEGRSYPEVDIEWWRRLADPFFKVHFRMNRALFDTLLVAVGRHMEATNRLNYPGMAIDVSLLMTLWVLATPDSFRSVGTRFGLAPGSVHNQFKTVIEVLRELRGRYICWPRNREMQVIARTFEEKYGYPSVAGCVDGCHIYINAPVEQPQRYINRHHTHSVILQGTCDHQLIFRDVHIGQPGSVGDSRTLRRSPLGMHLLRQPNFMGGLHILGDGAYTLTDKVMTPFRDYGNLTRRQREHNRVLSRCRSCIERAFALVKGKWRRLKFFHTLNLEYFMDALMACLVLHNFVLLEGNEYEDEGINFDEEEMCDGLYNELIRARKARGVIKREYIATMLYREGDE